jgi:hypothetical protein
MIGSATVTMPTELFCLNKLLENLRYFQSVYYAGQKILAVIVCQLKKKNCNPYFIVIMITVLIMNVIFWVVNFKT